MLKNKSKPFIGFLQATGLFLYIILISTFLYNISTIFDTEIFEFAAPVIMLLIFILSAVITASVVLGKPAILFWEKKYKEAFTLLGWTVAWGIFYLLLLVTYLSFLD